MPGKNQIINQGMVAFKGWLSYMQYLPLDVLYASSCTYANYAMDSPQVGFIFRVECPTVLYITCLVSVLVCAFYIQVPCWMPYSSLGAQPFGFAPLQPPGVYPWQAYVQPGEGHWSTRGMHRVAAPSTTLSRGSLNATQSAVSHHLIYMVGHTALGGLVESHPIPPPSLHGGEGSSFPGLVPSNDTINSESAMGIKPGDSGVVTGYQVDDFTHTWSAELVPTFVLGSLVRCLH